MGKYNVHIKENIKSVEEQITKIKEEIKNEITHASSKDVNVGEIGNLISMLSHSGNKLLELEAEKQTLQNILLFTDLMETE